MKVQELLERLENKQILTEREVKLVCERAKEILFEESNVTPVFAPGKLICSFVINIKVIVCGDVHGQFFDVLELFRKGGEIPNKNYIFIGDFVDRGYNSVETFEYLLCLKVLYPSHITLLRGNHESRQITTVYGFYDEITRKYGNANPWKQFVDVFDYLPLGAIIESEILCIHGGLSPSIKTIDQMRQIDRKLEIPHEGPFCDLMWSDPEEIETWALSNRGAGWLFGAKVTKEFSQLNGLNLICRAHQLVQEGYQFWFPDRNLVTVWSAPNYCYRCGNIAAILEIKENMDQQFITFKEVPESAKSVQPRNVLPYFL